MLVSAAVKRETAKASIEEMVRESCAYTGGNFKSKTKEGKIWEKYYVKKSPRVQGKGMAEHGCNQVGEGQG